jgi:Protein of unknwon function (DUF3310)
MSKIPHTPLSDLRTRSCAKRQPHDAHRWIQSKEDDELLETQFLEVWCPGINQPESAIKKSALPGGGAWERPDHYGGEENPFEAIKIIEHYDLNFNLGSVVKYVLRAPFKGTALEDLRKAYTYIGFEIRRRERAGESE